MNEDYTVPQYKTVRNLKSLYKKYTEAKRLGYQADSWIDVNTMALNVVFKKNKVHRCYVHFLKGKKFHLGDICVYEGPVWAFAENLKNLISSNVELYLFQDVLRGIVGFYVEQDSSLYYIRVNRVPYAEEDELYGLLKSLPQLEEKYNFVKKWEKGETFSED
jgi:hypothetical protein